MLVLEQNTTKKRNKNNKMEFDASDNNDSQKYKMEAICNNAVYTRESKSGHLIRVYYLISRKRYLEEKNTWEPTLAVQHLKKLISSFYKNHPNKPIATSPAIDIVDTCAVRLVAV